MKLYLVSIFNSVNAKAHFISDIIEANNEAEAEKSFVGKKYYFDHEQKRLLGTCRKANVIHEIK
jgi:hypothetical protein